jgi:TrkA domain protein
MAEVNETRLPGVGVRLEFACATGARIGVITRHRGRRELIVYDRRDPDRVQASIELSPEESAVLVELLGGTRVTEQLREVGREVDGLAVDWVPVADGFGSRTIGELGLRSRTGVSVVAIVRRGEPVPAPGPDDRIEPGDVLVVTGTPDGVTRAAALLAP